MSFTSSRPDRNLFTSVPLLMSHALFTGLVATAILQPAHAQLLGDLAPSTGASTRWGLGVAVTSRERPYAGVGSESKGLPILYVENRWLRVAGGTADLKVWRHAFGPQNSLNTALRLKYDDVGYKASDSAELAGMEKRKGALWGGAAADWATPWVRFSADWVADLSGHSKGQKLQLQADQRIALGSIGITPRVRAVWMDKKYVDYYFGVRSNEVTAERNAYQGKAGMSAEAGLRIDYAIARNHQVFMDASFTKLPDEVRLSPIVDRKDTSQITLGYMYRF